MRVFFGLCTIALLIITGCEPTLASRALPGPRRPITEENLQEIPATASPCHAGFTDGEYGCLPGDLCPNSMSDVRTMEGFHVIGLVDNGDDGKLMHVADTCQHYFCGIDSDCVKAGGSNESCMHPTGCLLVNKLKK